MTDKGRNTALTVDDDPNWTEEVADCISSVAPGLTVQRAGTKDQALQIIGSSGGELCLVVTDRHLRGILDVPGEGIDIARAAKEKGVPKVAILSATPEGIPEIEGVEIWNKSGALREAIARALD